MFIPVTETVRSVMGFVTNGVTMSIGVWARDNVSPNAPRTGVMNQVTKAWGIATLMPLLSVDTSLVRITSYDMTTVDGTAGVTTTQLPVQGGNPQPVPSSMVAAIVRLRTAARGRSGRGRNFVPGIPANVVNDEELTTQIMVDLVAAYVDLQQRLEADGMTHIIVSHQTNGVPNDPPIKRAVVTYDVANTITGLNRRQKEPTN